MDEFDFFNLQENTTQVDACVAMNYMKEKIKQFTSKELCDNLEQLQYLFEEDRTVNAAIDTIYELGTITNKARHILENTLLLLIIPFSISEDGSIKQNAVQYI